jgi:hypothetical protein
MALVVDQWPRGIPMTLAGKGFRTWAFIWPLTLGTPTDSKKTYEYKALETYHLGASLMHPSCPQNKKEVLVSSS